MHTKAKDLRCGLRGNRTPQLDPERKQESLSLPVPSAAWHFLGTLAWSKLSMWGLGKQPSHRGI